MKTAKWQLLICQLLLQNLKAERNFQIVATSFDCHSYKPEFIANAKCLLEQRNGTNYINGILRFHESIPTFKVHWLLDFYVTKRPKLTLVDLKLDGCTLLNFGYKIKFLKIGIQSIRKFLNAPLVCPLQKNFSYIIKDYVFDANVLPTYVPEANYRFSANIFHSENLAFSMVSKGKVMHNVN